MRIDGKRYKWRRDVIAGDTKNLLMLQHRRRQGENDGCDPASWYEPPAAIAKCRMVQFLEVKDRPI